MPGGKKTVLGKEANASVQSSTSKRDFQDEPRGHGKKGKRGEVSSHPEGRKVGR